MTPIGIMENRILLVDDEEGIRKVLGISLADSGYEVTTAENGEQALDIFKKTVCFLSAHYLHIH